MNSKEQVLLKYPKAFPIESMTLGEDRGGGDYDEKSCVLILIEGEEHFAGSGKTKWSTGKYWILGIGDTENQAWEYIIEKDAKPKNKWSDIRFPYISNSDISFVANSFREKYTLEKN
jgi:hypothetical protein